MIFLKIFILKTFTINLKCTFLSKSFVIIIFYIVTNSNVLCC